MDYLHERVRLIHHEALREWEGGEVASQSCLVLLLIGDVTPRERWTMTLITVMSSRRSRGEVAAAAVLDADMLFTTKAAVERGFCSLGLCPCRS